MISTNKIHLYDAPCRSGNRWENPNLRVSSELSNITCFRCLRILKKRERDAIANIEKNFNNSNAESKTTQIVLAAKFLTS
jgi:hypothetical protein